MGEQGHVLSQLQKAARGGGERTARACGRIGKSVCAGKVAQRRRGLQNVVIGTSRGR